MRNWQIFTAILGFLWVLFGAMAGHDVLLGKTAEYFSKAHRYHIIHTLALMWLILRPNFSQLIARLWSIGIIFFSGSLYLLSIRPDLPLRWIVPLGGIAFLVGWAVLCYQCYKNN